MVTAARHTVQARVYTCMSEGSSERSDCDDDCSDDGDDANCHVIWYQNT